MSFKKIYRCNEELKYNRPERVEILKKTLTDLWNFRDYTKILKKQLEQHNIVPKNPNELVLNSKGLFLFF